MAGLEDSCRNILNRIFEDLEERSDEFAMPPGKDFNRKRKLPFAEMMRTISIMEGNSLNKELCDIHNFNDSTFITKSAFDQQKGKIKHEAFGEAFNIFNEKTAINDLNLYEGYRLLTIDGSDINITFNKNSDTYFGPECSSSGKSYNRFHLNALYNINNNTYVDAVIHSSPKTHEIETARTMIKRLRKSSCSNITLTDRGYNSLDLLTTITDSNCDYLFRAHAKFLKEII